MNRRNTVAVFLISAIMLVSFVSIISLSTAPVTNVQTVSPFTVGGGTGLSAEVVATSHQVIRDQIINASGYDVGIYVGPGVTGVKIINVTVTNANDHGIFVQDASNIMIKNSLIMHNGVNPTSGIHENKAIELVGTSNSFVLNNVVKNNFADGGIGIADDGPSLDPGAPLASAAHPLASSNNVVKDNLVQNNAFGCGIVVASYNQGGGVTHNIVAHNTVLATGAAQYVPGTIPFVGGIVMAADTPNTTATNNIVKYNFISGSLIPGIVVHSNAPGDFVSGTILTGNNISNNGLEAGDPNTPQLPAGIMIVAEKFPGQMNPPAIDHTFVLSNTISHDYYGVFINNATRTLISNLQTSSVFIPVYTIS